MSRQQQTRRHRRATAAFTLLETLVAVTVMVALLAFVPRGVATSAGMSGRAGDHLAARLVARAVLDDWLAGRTLAPGHVSGRIAGNNWSATIAPAPGFDAAASNWLLFRITVAVDAGAGRVYRVETLRIGQAR